MSGRPHVLLSVATSVDGCIDDTTQDRLLLSNEADFDRVDQVRADSDAVMIGAGTMRGDNPRMLVKSERRRAERRAKGLSDYPLKVTLTRSGDLDPELRWFQSPGDRVVYTVDESAGRLRAGLGQLAEIVSLGSGEPDFGALLDDLGARGVGRLMVEGGEQIHTALLSRGLVDEIHLVVAPLLVGAGPRFLAPTSYPWSSRRRMRLAGVETIGDVVLLRYHPNEESTIT
jgi:5-amino-6-(5-phosphoribosylamino)uracil reductase